MRVRFSLASLVAAVFVAAALCAGLRYGMWGRMLSFLSVVVLLAAAVLATLTPRKDRTFIAAFAVFGLGFLFFFALAPHAYPSTLPLHTELADWVLMHAQSSGLLRGRVYRDDFRQGCDALLAVAIAVVAGLAARAIAQRRPFE
jgi:hypothetical protein